MIKKILVVDDEKDIRFILNDILSSAGYNVVLKSTIKETLEYISSGPFDVALIDVLLDEKSRDGIYLLKSIKEKNRDIPVIIMSGHATIQIAVNSIKEGAFEFLEKPFNQDRLLNFIKRALEYQELISDKKSNQENFFKLYEFIGENKEILKIKNSISKIASTDTRVLIEGSSGVGKELLAREVHKTSNRNEGKFVVLDAAVLNEINFDKEIYGSIENGKIHPGFLEKANKGTLFIDNVSELSLSLQTKLLRLLIDQKFKRVNDDIDIKVNFRLITSSSINLKKEVMDGNFREDLYHRINVLNIYIPELKDRASDVPLLVKYFFSKFGKNFSDEMIKSFDSFYTHDWPGNVRELRNLVERICILGDTSKESVDKIINDHFNSEFNVVTNKSTNNLTLKEAREDFERNYLKQQLKKYDGNISKTADAIGMERSALHRKLTSLNIKN